MKIIFDIPVIFSIGQSIVGAKNFLPQQKRKRFRQRLDNTAIKIKLRTT